MTAIKDKISRKNNAMIRTQVFLRAEQKDRLSRVAKHYNTKSSEIFRKGLDKILDEYEKIPKKNWIDGFEENWNGAFSSEKRGKEFEQEISKNRKFLNKRPLPDFS